MYIYSINNYISVHIDIFNFFTTYNRGSQTFHRYVPFFLKWQIFAKIYRIYNRLLQSCKNIVYPPQLLYNIGGHCCTGSVAVCCAYIVLVK